MGPQHAFLTNRSKKLSRLKDKLTRAEKEATLKREANEQENETGMRQKERKGKEGNGK